MPRNSSGTYSLPAGNPVVTATTISSTWANTTLSDIATALTDSLSRSGDGGMTAPLELDDGVVGAPGLTWASEPTSGLYRAGAGDHRYSISATDVVQITANGLRAANGAAATPSFSFISDTNTGFYHNASTDSFSAVTGGVERVKFWTGSLPLRLHSTDTSGDVALGFYESDGTTQKGYIGYAGSSDDVFSIWSNENANVVLATNGIARLTISTSAVTSTLPVMAPDGSAGSPAVTFSGDTDTGVYRSSADSMGFSAGGTLRFSVSNGFVLGRVPSYFPDGSAASPTYSFENDTDTGFYRDTANQIGIALGGSTAGQITQGTFTGTLTGCTTSPTATFNYQRFGNLVVVWCTAGLTGTSNATTCTITGAPAIIRPTTQTVHVPCSGTFIDNGISFYTGTVEIATGGTFTLALDLVSGTKLLESPSGWTNANSKGITNRFCIVYEVN